MRARSTRSQRAAEAQLSVGGRPFGGLRHARGPLLPAAPAAYHRLKMSDFLGDTRDLLRRTPDVLRALLTGLPETWTATPDMADGWRPRDVVGHLISGELDDWIPRTAADPRARHGEGVRPV